ncbi:MAG: tautomerase family protein [Spirochaetes bacterium]|nr:tautomerase family protein [Spirochaetota bacterium]
MPVITVESAGLTLDQKRQLAESLTRTAAGIMKSPEQAITVLIRENGRENIGIGGKLLADME